MRTEDKVINNGKLQAKQEELKSLHCPSPQSSLFNSRDSLINTRLSQHLFAGVSTELLRHGQCVRFRAPGLSMHPTIKEGETIIVAPIAPFDIKRGDILLYLAGMKVVAHRVVRIKREKNDSVTQSTSHSSAYSSIHASTPSWTLNPQLIFILRGDASAICDEPVAPEQVLGKVVSVEKRGCTIDLYSRRVEMLRILHAWASRFKRLILSILR